MSILNENTTKIRGLLGGISNLPKDRYEEGYEKGYSEGFAEGEIVGAEKSNPIYYAAQMYSTFHSVVFPENSSLVLRFKKPPINMYQTFGKAVGLKRVKIITDDKDTSWKLEQTFRENTNIEVIDLTECSRKFTNVNYAFMGTTALKSILGALDVSQCTSFNTSFNGAGLQDIEFVPNTIKASISFRSGSLTLASVESIINGLADLTGSAAQTIGFDLYGKYLTDEQKARIAAKNWTLTMW